MAGNKKKYNLKKYPAYVINKVLRSFFNEERNTTTPNNDLFYKTDVNSEVNNRKQWLDPSVLINLLLALATFLLFWEATKQSSISKQSADAATIAAKAADSSFHESINYDSISLAKQDSSIKSNNEYNKKRFALDSISLQTQINSIKENQNEFEIANQAYLQINGFDTLKNYEENHTLSYFITNLSTQPAFILKGYTASHIDYPQVDIYSIINRFEKTKPEFRKESLYIIKESPQKKSAIDRGDQNRAYYVEVKRGNMDVYFFGSFIYKNLITNKIRLYKFAYEISFKDAIGYTTIYNENTEYKSDVN